MDCYSVFETVLRIVIAFLRHFLNCYSVFETLFSNVFQKTKNE
nr:MAG TPA: hypothetical protein [Caudoviricetes sp.]